ncbi:hypothetical protein HDU76_006757 [Blyttiomyces sp. JEL0837]|nr:hypothetical protein HDU76_006757 [Blyttiomyces sp. JEL0837]
MELSTSRSLRSFDSGIELEPTIKQQPSTANSSGHPKHSLRESPQHLYGESRKPKSGNAESSPSFASSSPVESTSSSNRRESIAFFRVLAEKGGHDLDLIEDEEAPSMAGLTEHSEDEFCDSDVPIVSVPFNSIHKRLEHAPPTGSSSRPLSSTTSSRAGYSPAQAFADSIKPFRLDDSFLQRGRRSERTERASSRTKPIESTGPQLGDLSLTPNTPITPYSQPSGSCTPSSPTTIRKKLSAIKAQTETTPNKIRPAAPSPSIGTGSSVSSRTPSQVRSKADRTENLDKARFYTNSETSTASPRTSQGGTRPVGSSQTPQHSKRSSSLPRPSATASASVSAPRSASRGRGESSVSDKRLSKKEGSLGGDTPNQPQRANLAFSSNAPGDRTGLTRVASSPMLKKGTIGGFFFNAGLSPNASSTPSGSSVTRKSSTGDLKDLRGAVGGGGRGLIDSPITKSVQYKSPVASHKDAIMKRTPRSDVGHVGIHASRLIPTSIAESQDSSLVSPVKPPMASPKPIKPRPSEAVFKTPEASPTPPSPQTSPQSAKTSMLPAKSPGLIPKAIQMQSNQQGRAVKEVEVQDGFAPGGNARSLLTTVTSVLSVMELLIEKESLLVSVKISKGIEFDQLNISFQWQQTDPIARNRTSEEIHNYTKRLRNLYANSGFSQTFEEQMSQAGLVYLFPKAAARLNLGNFSGYQHLSAQAHFESLEALNQLVSMALQLKNDVKLTNHKYIAHQLALLYQTINLVGGDFIQYHSRIQTEFDSIKTMTSNPDVEEPQLNPDQKKWLTSLASDIVATALYSNPQQLLVPQVLRK